MRRPLSVLALLTATCAAGPIAASAQRLAVTHVTVFDVREGVARPGMTVVVSGDRIAAVGTSGFEVPADARVVDGTGRFFIPGLWDMHVDTGSDRNAREVVFLNEGEASSVEDRWEMDLQYARWVADGELVVPDSATRAYFLRLASEEAAQAEIRAVYRDLVAPAHRVANERFRRAFGNDVMARQAEGER